VRSVCRFRIGKTMTTGISKHRRRFARWLILLVFTASCASLGWTQDEPLVVVQGGKYGYIDHAGKIIIQPRYIWAEDFWRGLGTVYACGHYLSIDASGTLHPLRIALPGELEIQRRGDKLGFVDKHGQFKIKPAFDDALPFSDGVAAVKIGEKWGFVDAEGKLVIDAKFKNAYYFWEGVTTAELPGLGDVLIDKSGKILASDFKSVDLITEGRVPVGRNDKRGYLDLQGTVIIPIVYDGAQSFSEGLAAVEKDDKWGYIDRAGRLVIPFTYDDARKFGNGLAAVKAGKRTGFINRSGEFAIDLPFMSVSGFPTYPEISGSAKAGTAVSRFWTDEGSFGIVDISGRVIWGPTEQGPDHPPLFGWTDEEKAESCEGIPQSVKSMIANSSSH
jgi:hypothetical protein